MSRSTNSGNFKMRRSITEDQMTEVMKAKMYVNQVTAAYQQLKEENHRLQQQLSVLRKGNKKQEDGCDLCSTALNELRMHQTENRLLKSKLSKEAEEKDDWKNRHDAVLHLLRDSNAELSSAREELDVYHKQSGGPTPADSPRSFLSDVLKRTKASSGGSSNTTSISYSFGENSDDCASPQDQYIAAFLHPQKEDTSKHQAPAKHNGGASHGHADSASGAGWGGQSQEPRRRAAPMRFPLGESKRTGPVTKSTDLKRQDYQSTSAAKPVAADEYYDVAMASPEHHARMADAHLSSSNALKHDSMFAPPPIKTTLQPKPVARLHQNPSANHNQLPNPQLHSLPHQSSSNALPMPRGPLKTNMLYTSPAESIANHARQVKAPKQQLFTQQVHQQAHQQSPNTFDDDDMMDDDLPYHCVQPATSNWQSIHVGHVHPPQVLRVHVSPDNQERIMDAEVYEGEVAASEPDDMELYPAPRAAMHTSHHIPNMHPPNVSSMQRPLQSSGQSSDHSAQSSEDLSTQTLDLVGSLLQSLRSTLGEGEQAVHQLSAASSARSAASVAPRQSGAATQAQTRHQQEIAAAVEERVRGGAYWNSKGAGPADTGGQQRGGSHAAADKIWQSGAMRTAAAAHGYENNNNNYAYKPKQGKGLAPTAELHNRQLRGDLPSFL